MNVDPRDFLRLLLVTKVYRREAIGHDTTTYQYLRLRAEGEMQNPGLYDDCPASAVEPSSTCQ